ncbi:MAG: tetratricopeptide repeat protein [Thermoplasmata archaeon]
MAEKKCPVCGAGMNGSECPACGAIIVNEKNKEVQERAPEGGFAENMEPQIENKTSVEKNEFRIEDLPLPEIIAEQQELSEKQRNFVRKMEFDSTAINTVPTAVDRIFERKPFASKYRAVVQFLTLDFLLSLTAYSFLIFLLGYLLGYIYIIFTPNNFFLLHIDSIAFTYTIFLGIIFLLAMVLGRKEIKVQEKTEKRMYVLTALGVFLLYFVPLCENFYILVLRDWLIRLSVYLCFGIAGGVLIAYSFKKCGLPGNYQINFLSTLFLFTAVVGGGIALKHLLIVVGEGAPPPPIMTYSAYLHFGMIDFYLFAVVGLNLLVDYRKLSGRRNQIESWAIYDIKNAYESIAHMNYILAIRYCARAEKNLYEYIKNTLTQKGITPTEAKILNFAKTNFPFFAELKLVKGYAFYKLDRLEDAEYEIYHALDADLNNAQGWLLYGNILHAKGEDEHAIKCYANGVKVNPYLPELWNNLGNIYLIQRKFREAEVCYSRATAIDRNFREALANRSYLYLKQEKYELALKYADLALGIKPKKKSREKKKGG